MKYISFLASCLILISALHSCSDDKVAFVGTLDAPVITVTDRTSHSIAYRWDAVPGARQYGYTLTGPGGDVLDAGVTTADTARVDSLTPYTMYTISVTAFPTIVGSASSSKTVMDVLTLFYDPIKDYESTYICHLMASTAETALSGTIDEDRSAEDYIEYNYGVFTISAFCGKPGYDMVFTVNRDNTITILNGERQKDDNGEDTRIVSLLTGYPVSPKDGFNKIFIDESTAIFNGPGCTLTFSAKNNGSRTSARESDSEIITWKHKTEADDEDDSGEDTEE